MKITKISQQVKKADRFSIFVDDTYVFSLGESALLEQKIYVGQEVTPEELEAFKHISEFDLLYARTLGLIARRPRSTWEIQDYLRRRKSPALLSDQILNKLSKAGLLDDSDFARRWVESRRLLRPVSKRKLVQELKQKRVPTEVIEQVLSEDETDERTVLAQLVAKKRKQTKYHDPTKLMQYLARQGFGYGDIKHALGASDLDD